MKKDEYSRRRDGKSTIFQISCAICGNNICQYQKDGIGALRRMYIDRISKLNTDADVLVCPSCGSRLGYKIVYTPEKRLAYNVYHGKVRKTKIV